MTEVFYERLKSLQPVGMPIHVRHGSSMRAATANAVRLRGRLFYIAPCYAFFDRLYKSNTPTAKPNDDFEINSDSETEYDGELEASITSIGVKARILGLTMMILRTMKIILSLPTTFPIAVLLRQRSMHPDWPTRQPPPRHSSK